MDNLPSVTYQTFEQDPVKYMLYEEAMVRAFADHSDGKNLCAHHYVLFSVDT